MFIDRYQSVSKTLRKDGTILTHGPEICEHDKPQYHYYYYRCSALGSVWAETRVQSGDWYGSGTLHLGQVLRGSLPLLSPRLDVPTSAT